MIDLTTNGLNAYSDDNFKFSDGRQQAAHKQVLTCKRSGKPKYKEIPPLVSRSSPSKKAQFMIMTIVFIALAFFTIFLLIRTVDRSAVVMFEPQSTHFDNLRNAIILRNSYGISEDGFCAHMNDTMRAAQEKLECGIQNTYSVPPGVIQTNYSINYTTTDFSFRGFLS